MIGNLMISKGSGVGGRGLDLGQPCARQVPVLSWLQTSSMGIAAAPTYSEKEL